MVHTIPPAPPDLKKIEVKLPKPVQHPYFKKVYLPFLAVLILGVSLVVGVPLLRRITHLLTPASASLVDLSFSTPTTTLARGQQFSVNVLIDAKTYQVSAATMAATFSPTHFQLVSVTPGPFLTAAIPAGYSAPFVQTTTTVAGNADIIVGAACPLVVPTPNPTTTPCSVRSGAGILATLTFQVLANAPTGSTQLAFDTTAGRTDVAAISSATSVLGDANPITLTVTAPTASPTSAALNFKIKFQGVTSQRPAQTVTVTFRQGTTDTLQTVTVTSDAGGTYSGLASTTSGTYDILITGPAHLRKKMATALSLSPTTPLQDWTAVLLPAGDANHDNKVDLLDYSALVLKFNPGVTGD